MKNLNFLSTIGGTAMGLQSSDTGYRCRVVTDSLPFFCRVKMLRFISALVLILTIGVGQMWGAYSYAGTGTFTKQTSIDGNGYYVIVLTSSGAMTSSASSNYVGVNTSYNGSASSISNPATSIVLQVTNYDSTNKKYYISNSSGNYLYSSGDKKIAYSATSQYWEIATVSNKKRLKTAQSTVVYMGYVANSGFRPYTNSSSNVQEVTAVYKLSTSCSNKVTVTKSSASNGSFELKAGSASGTTINNNGTVDNCDANATIVLIPSANTHYHVDEVTASNNTSISGPDASGNYTITYTKGSNISTTIGVTFAADPTYTVTWVAGSNSSFHTQTNYAGTALTDPGTPSAASYCPGGKVFVGWTATPIDGEGSAPADLFTSVSGKSIPINGTTYYAVFATASGSGPTNATKVYSGANNADVQFSTGSNSSNNSLVNSNGYTAGKVNVKFAVSSGTNYSYYDGTVVRYYANNSITITPLDGVTITRVEIVRQSTTSSNSGVISVSGLTASANNTTTNTNVFTGTATSAVTFTNNGQCRFSAINVTYSYNNTTYSNYATTCCTPLGSITGTVSLNQSGSDLVANGWGATTGGNETRYLVKLYNSDKSSVLNSGNTDGTAKTYTFENPGAGTYWVSVTPTYSGAGNYCASGDETFSAASIDISGKVVITFKKNGAIGTDDQTQEVDYNTETALEDVSARSYTAPSCKEFGGWASSQANATAGTVAYANGANITATEATTLWAIWKTKTFAVTDGTIASSVASHSYSVTPIACGNDLTITCAAAAAYKGNPTVTATGTHGAITVNSATSVTIANVQSAIAVSIAYNTPKETATVILHDATGAHTQDGSYYEADNYTLPNTAAACTESELYGWYTETYVDQPTAPTGEKYIAKEASKALVAGENHFYAVYATIEDRYTNNYTKITSVGDLTTGDYLISSGSYCMKNTVNSSRMDEVSVTASENVKTTENTSCVWTITKNGSRVTLYSGEKYLAINSGSIAMQAGSYEFTFDYGTTKSNSWTFTSVTEPTQQLSYSGSPKYFRPATSQTDQIDLYKRDKAPSAGAPYTTSPSCTTHDLTSAIDPSSPVSGTVDLGKTTILEGKTTTAEATPSEHYTFSHWTISGTGASLSDANANPVTVTMGTADATITAHFTEKEKCTVVFKNNGVTKSSETYWLGENPVAPTLTDGHDHDACDETSTTHYGWTQTAWTETLTKEQVDAKTAADVKVYAKAAALPAITAEDDGNTIEYHAVWAQASGGGSSSVFNENFSSCDGTGGNDGSWSGSIATTTLPTAISSSWNITYGNAAKGCIKLGSGSSTGHAITPSIDCGSATTATLTFRAGAWNNSDDGTTLTLSYTNCSGDKSTVTLVKGSFTEYTVNLSNITDDIKIDFYVSDGSKHRFFLDDVDVTCAGGTSYSAFLTTCTPSHTVSSAVSPAGKATVTLGATSVAEGSTTTAEYSGITAGYEFVNWTISGTGASLSSTTDNPTTITMGTANVTVTANLQCITPSISGQPAVSTTCLVGATPELSVTAAAGGASLSYQWQQCATIDGTYVNVASGGTSSTYSPSTAAAGTTYYKCVVTNAATGCSTSATSDPATVTVNAPSGYCISLYNSNNNGIQSGFSNGGDGNEYTLAFTVPGKDGSDNWPEYWIGENEAWASFSANATFADMKFTSSNATIGLAEGATGTLHIWDNNKEDGSNLWVKFEPDGYGFRWGDHESDDWTAAECTKAFTVDAGNANTYWTEMVTLDGTNNTAWDYYVGLQTASGYVYSGVDNEASDSRGISRTRSVTAMKVSNGTAGSFKETFLNSEPTGTTGKFRIWNNNITDYNFVCHFVPFYQLKYNANGGSGTMDPLPATPVSCEESAANRTVTVAANAFTAPTGKQFVKWNTAANGSGADVNAGEYVLTSDVTLYAIWGDVDYTVTVNQSPDAGAATTGQTTTGHYGATINLTTTVPDGYEFVNWTSSDVTITNPTSEDGASFTMPAKNVTVTANFKQVYTITWSNNGATTTSTVDAGSKLVLPEDEPASCNAGYSTFIGWYSVAAGSAEEPSANVSGTKADADHTPTGNETYYAVWGNGELVGGWQKVTSITVGDVVIFVNETASKEMSDIALINTNMYGIATAYSTSPAGTYPLTIEAGNGGSGYSFKTSANTYLSWSSNNTLTTSDTKNIASSWTISTSTNGNFKFANVETTERIMQFNNNSGQHRWACYGNDNQTAFQIYKQAAGATGFISNCCEEWTASAKYGESNVINVNNVVAVTVTGTVHGTASYESDDTDVLTVASDGKITGKKAGSATVTISWAGADGYCAYETTVDVTVNGTITITYNANDGSLTPETTSQNATSNSAFTLDANSFSRTGYTFQGWTTTPSGDKEYNNSQADVEFAEDVTLYAVWSINSHAVTLNQPTGNTIEATGAANLASVAYGTSITLSATENDGYVFTGWSATGVSLANTNPVVFSMPDKDVAVTATYSTYSWIAADPRYTVTIAPKISYTKVEKFSTAGVVIKENFKRSDDNTITKQETYAGAWTAKLNGVAIANDADLSLDDNGKTLKLYIGEEEIASYTLTVSDVAADQFIDGLWGNTTILKTDDNYTVPSLTETLGDAGTCDDHTTFIGWVLEANAENPTDDNKIAGGTTGQTPSNKTYYAIWAEHYSGNKDFDASKTSFASGETGLSSSVSINTDIRYNTVQNGGTNGPAVLNSGVLRLYRKNSGDNVGGYITISAASGATISSVEFEVSTTNAVKYRAGAYSAGNMSDVTITDGKVTVSGLSVSQFTLANADGDHQLDISSITVAYSKHVEEDKDYITDCDPRYDVEFLAGDGATGSYDKVTKKAGVEITLPDGSALSKDHHTFAGWYSAYYDVTYSESTSMTYTVPVDGDILEAQWTEDHHAFVTFKNGENTIGEPLKVYDGGTFDLLGAQEADGKAFIGWKWNSNKYKAGQDSQHMDDPAVDRTYTAVWMPLINVATIADADLTDGKWILVENKSQLKAGDFIVIAAAGYDVAMSNYQKNSNRAEAAVTKNNDTLSYTSNVAPLFLQYDPENDYYAFYDRAYDTNNDGTADGSGYLYSDNNLKTQTTDINGFQGVWSISIADKKASIVAQGNNSDKIMRYNKGSNLFNCYGTATQSDIAIYKWAKNISGNVDVSDLALTDAVIVKDGATLIINTPAILDNVVVEVGGKVTNTNNLTVNNLTIKSEAGKSGQVTDGDKITVNGDLYMDVTFFKGATTLDAETANRWYMISAPFDVNLADGFSLTDGTPMTFGTASTGYVFDLFEYDGSKRANTGVTGWKRAQGKMPAGTACLIGFNAGQPTTIRLKAASTTLTEKTSITLQAFDGDATNQNWNGVANPTLHYTDISHDVQTYNNEDGENGRKYIGYSATSTSFVVGTAFFVQETGTISLSPATHGSLRAPQRESERYEACVQIFREGATEFADQMYVRASESALNEYEQGHDMITWNGTTGNTAMIWAENYGKRLAIEEAPLVNNKASYELGIFAPKAGTYSISVAAPQENAELYLTKNGHIIWNLTMSPCELELTQGQNNEYGLMLRANVPSVSTDVEGIQPSADSIQKVIIDEKVFILRGGQLYGIDGKTVR